MSDGAIEQTKSALKAEANGLVTWANELAIVDDASYLAAAEGLKGVKAYLKKVGETFDPIAKAQYDAWKLTKATAAQFSDPAEKAESTAKGKIQAFAREQEAIRRQKEAELRALAMKQEEDRRLAEAAELEKAGQKEEAAALISAPVEAPPVVLPSAVPTVKGLSFRENWTFEVVAPNLVPREYLIVNESALRAVAKTQKAQAQVPGVRFYDAGSVGSGS